MEKIEKKSINLQRKKWVDYSKGIGIILVVFAHCITHLGAQKPGG